jgi:GntR family transcriptional regulator, transcriptional repressor for pyruvate dehydrogenase complex
MVPSINRKKLSESVIEEIKKMIERGELSLGDKLPNQNEFAAQLGVSRTVLREALQTLNQLGVIDQRPKYGTVIRAKTPFLYSEHLIPPLMSDNNATIELIQARRFIEVGAAEMAARNASKAQIKDMGRLVDEMERMSKAGDDAEYAEKNIAFHFLIAKACHNRFMVHLLATIRGFMEQWTQESISVLPGLLDRSVKSHREIYEAIRDREPRKAASSMRRHIADFQKSLEKFYKMTGRGN